MERTTKRALGQGMGFGARMHSLEEVLRVFAMYLT